MTSAAFDLRPQALLIDARRHYPGQQGRAEASHLEGRVPWDEGLDKAGIAFKIASAAGNRIRVIAGPGTGKSYAMKRRVARLLEENVPPEKVLAVTFTRVAAEDLHGELQKLDVPGCEELEGQTLHGLAMRILARQHVLNSVGRTPRPLNNFEQKAMYSDIAPLTGGKKKCKALVEAYEAAWARSQGDEPGFPATDEEKAFQKILIDWHLFHKSMLIGEVIPYLVRYLKDNPAADEHSEFDHVLADEYQDLNKAEQTAIAYLSEVAHICIVGDDDQSIYSFKSAHPGRHPAVEDDSTPVARISRWRNASAARRRSSRMANSLISHNTQREPRELKPIDAKGKCEVQIVQLPNSIVEASWIAKKINDLLGKRRESRPTSSCLCSGKRAARVILNALKAAEAPREVLLRGKPARDGRRADAFRAVQAAAATRMTVSLLRYLLGLGSTNFRATRNAKLRAHCENTGRHPL